MIPFPVTLNAQGSSLWVLESNFPGRNTHMDSPADGPASRFPTKTLNHLLGAMHVPKSIPLQPQYAIVVAIFFAIVPL